MLAGLRLGLQRLKIGMKFERLLVGFVKGSVLRVYGGNPKH